MFLPIKESNAADIATCTIFDLNITATIPKGYRLVPSNCPKVFYVKRTKQNRALGFYIIENHSPFTSDYGETAAEFLRGQIIITLTLFRARYGGTNYNVERIDEVDDFPPALIEEGGVCGGLHARLPLSYQGMHGVEWRQGIICLVEFPPSGSNTWKLIQAFYFDMNLENADYKPKNNFGIAARELFRSIAFKH